MIHLRLRMSAGQDSDEQEEQEAHRGERSKGDCRQRTTAKNACLVPPLMQPDDASMTIRDEHSSVPAAWLQALAPAPRSRSRSLLQYYESLHCSAAAGNALLCAGRPQCTSDPGAVPCTLLDQPSVRTNNLRRYAEPEGASGLCYSAYLKRLLDPRGERIICEF